MKRFVLMFATLGLLFACTPENNNNNGSSQNNLEELTITGEALDVTDYSATLTGYANLPFELGDAEVGIMYDKQQSFEDAKKVIATGLDGNNKFTVTATGLKPSTKYYYKSYVQNGMAVKYGAVKSFTTQAQRVTSITLDKSFLQLVIGHQATLSVTSVQPDNANDKTYTWSSSDSSIASVDNSGRVTAKAKGNATIKATANDGSGVFASCSVEVYRIDDVPQAVDMGTVVNGKNIKWASFNIGASSPDEYGFYYAWGETEPKENYSWSTYKFGTSSSGPFSKYNTNSSYGPIDNKTILEPEDDVAHVKLGGKWRMPTDAEWTELRTKCTWTWKTNYNGTGINGSLVTAPNGNSIFLPAAGFRYDTTLDDAGSYGRFWSSSLYSDNPSYAWSVYFYSGNVLRGGSYRYFGRSVRPVSE